MCRLLRWPPPDVSTKGDAVGPQVNKFDQSLVDVSIRG